jgi:peptide/nickel transport system permease protein
MQMGGAIIVETIYNVKGMGMYMMNAINSRDYPIVLAMVLLTSFIVCAMNLIVDIAYALVDPRIKGQYASPKRKAKLMQNGKKEVAKT